ncbi:probable sugar phosphate/phosphate translocator At5g05820 [Anneissia japonica]|uniref:probable sugar phosphate/phosphate translocator At5g05820 n=1 Tax=Anneissia japonica TaxID=1529436 RepID=UPI0014257B3A|nr:probable sugar phosphate/phosphate translocator At5g05820 [Anneissia japonica]XP_033102270.1 probable sugar phosphate/phosphate translocator At5g05820 [Anneissia japonica]
MFRIDRLQVMTAVSICGWLFLSITIGNLNKWIFTNHNFNYPVFLTTLHVLTTYSVISVTLHKTPLGMAYDDQWKILPTIQDQKIQVLSVMFAASIALGNVAIKYLYISFAKMIFALTPLMTVLVSKVLLNKTHDKYTYIALIPLFIGSVLCTLGEVNFSVIGFLAAILSTFLRSLKSLLQGFLLKEERIDSICLLYYMSLPSLLLLLMATVIFEYHVIWDLNLYTNIRLWCLILCSCFCAVGYNMMNFVVTYFTCPITLQVLGNISVLLNVLVSVFIFNNEVSLSSWIGMFGIMLGTVLYHKVQLMNSMQWALNRGRSNKQK